MPTDIAPKPGAPLGITFEVRGVLHFTMPDGSIIDQPFVGHEVKESHGDHDGPPVSAGMP